MTGCVGCFLLLVWGPIILLALSFGFVVAPFWMAVFLIALVLAIIFRR